MAATTIIGALLIVLGLLYTALTAIYRGRMSEPRSSPQKPTAPTLEPRDSGVRAFSLKANWPGLLFAVIGALVLLAPFFLGPPSP
ncbi:MAG TPA: hypothetical protein VGO70_01525 [Arsenicitalea sp.]|jgi:hypothetical protein|nr:hypothetical protein [Arsenicitalea sp.]